MSAAPTYVLVKTFHQHPGEMVSEERKLSAYREGSKSIWSSRSKLSSPEFGPEPPSDAQTGSGLSLFASESIVWPFQNVNETEHCAF